ncbi:hypothetical protein PHLCEN_2v9728 [Hermanssonia centrifuga]|uniref:Uncharacterized protein n=1 Tax=Hermanssonia centrifuga TaxID=98765 RepID=A0A2R6NQ07_9APHY|nr:hypothetical protein PHLCEN_2v9728 [Hermanssonia centrifuga]
MSPIKRSQQIRIENSVALLVLLIHHHNLLPPAVYTMSGDLSHKMEVGTMASTVRGDADEAELARMGYKQELK